MIIMIFVVINNGNFNLEKKKQTFLSFIFIHFYKLNRTDNDHFYDCNYKIINIIGKYA